MDFDELVDKNDVDEALAHDGDVVKAKVELADKACDYWKSIYPVEQDDRATPPRPPGTGRDAIHVAQHGDSVYVVNDDPIGYILEYGSATTPEFATRARTEEYFNKGGGQR